MLVSLLSNRSSFRSPALEDGCATLSLQSFKLLVLSTVSHVLSNIYLANFLLVSLENQHIVILSIKLCTQLMISENTGLLTKTKSTSWHYFLQASFSRKALWNGAHYSQKHFENEWVNILHHSEMLPKPQRCCREGCVMSRACLGGWGSSANQEYSSSFFFFFGSL